MSHRDPRWDRQVEARSSYYATLSLEVRLGADVLMGRLEGADVQLASLLESVLVERARRGDGEALANVKRRVLVAEEPSMLLWSLAGLGVSEALEGVPEILVADADDEQLAAIVAFDTPEVPWAEWAVSHPRIRAALLERPQRGGRARLSPPPPVGSSIEQILAHPWSGGWPRWLRHRFRGPLTDSEVTLLRDAATGPFGPRREVALEGLAQRRDPFALPTAESVFRRNVIGRERRSAFTYIRALDPSDTLPLARAWITVGDGRVDIAGDLLAIHSEPCDVPAIRAALVKAWTDRDMYGLCSLVRGLGRHPALGPFPELNDVFEQVEYSYARKLTAHALAATADDFPDRYALECLWDCEADTRAVGVKAVHSADPRASSRLADITADPGEG